MEKFYGLIYNIRIGNAYLAHVDLENNTVKYISTLGVRNTQQFNVLALIPEEYLSQ